MWISSFLLEFMTEHFEEFQMFLAKLDIEGSEAEGILRALQCC